MAEFGMDELAFSRRSHARRVRKGVYALTVRLRVHTKQKRPGCRSEREEEKSKDADSPTHGCTNLGNMLGKHTHMHMHMHSACMH